MSTADVGPPASTRLAAACWIAAGLVYLSTEAATASMFPGYSYAANYISDLGIPEVETLDGRVIDSPWHAVMNSGFVLHGVLFVAAAVLATPVLGRTLRRTLLVPAATHGVGIVLVGLVHGGQTDAVGGLGALHGIGAAMAIVGGNLAAIVAGLALRRRDGPRRLGVVCASLGVVGLLSALALVLDSGSSTIDVLQDGTWERMAVYTITAFELLLGAVTLLRLRRSGTSAPRRSGRPAA